MRAYNETKLLTLSFIDEIGEVTAVEMAEYLDVTPAGASSYLRKLNRQGLIYRRKLRVGRRLSRERVYWLSEKGSRKMAWLETREEVLYPTFADEVETTEPDEVFVPIWSDES